MVKSRTTSKSKQKKAPKKKTRVLVPVVHNKNNKQGLNQYTEPDPRQSLYLAFYLDPNSETFSNSLQSALKAGYSQEYAESLTAQMPAWLSEKLGEMDFIQRAERNISYVLDLPTKIQAMGAFGPLFVKKGGKKTNEPILVENAKLLKIKADTSEFVLERLASGKFGKKGAPGDKPPGAIVPIQINFGDMREKYS